MRHAQGRVRSHADARRAGRRGARQGVPGVEVPAAAAGGGAAVPRGARAADKGGVRAAAR